MNRAWAFLQHRWRSNSRHGVHSPFVYRLIDECIYASLDSDYSEISRYFKRLSKDQTLVEGFDHGQGQHTARSVAHYASRSAMPDHQAELLARLVQYLAPQRILELGTNLGKSAAFMAHAAPTSHITGVEGNEALALQAFQNFERLHLENTQVVDNTFDAFLSGTSEKYDLVFLDGDHRLEPTLRYFNALKNHLAKSGLIVLHDIYYSEEMNKAWSEIKKDRDVQVTVDLFFFGLVWLDLPQAKEDFSVRFPERLLSLLT